MNHGLKTFVGLRRLRAGSVTLGLSLAVLASLSLTAPVAAQNFKGLQTRPIPLGVSGSSIEHILSGAFAYCYAGTLGSLVTDGTHQYILSNNHVLAKENDPDNALAPDGYDIIQPGLLDEGPCSLSLGEPADVVARLTDYVELLFGKGRNAQNNDVDAAIAETVTGDVDTSGRILGIGPLTSGALPTATLGMKVQKSGRTTGHTYGQVAATDVSLNVKYNSGTARFVHQIEVTGLCGTSFSDAGDSGSLIVNLPEGAPRAAVGLLFAGGGGSTFANPIDLVLSEVGAVARADLSMVVGGSGDVDDVTGNGSIPTCQPSGGGDVQAADDSYNLPKKSDILTVGAPGVLGNDTGSTLKATPVSGPAHGNLDLMTNGGFTYTYTGSDRNADGSDSFTYQASDGATLSNPATVTIGLASRGGGGRPHSAGAPVGLDVARAVRAAHEDELFEIPGVLGSGIGADAAGNAVIRVYVERAAQSADHPIPAALEGVPVQVVVTGPILAR